MKPESLINLILQGIDNVNDIVIDRVSATSQNKETCVEIKYHSVRGECPLPKLVEALKKIVRKRNESEVEKVYKSMLPQ